MAVERYRRKPRSVQTHEDQYAARYNPGENKLDLWIVAKMCDRNAELIEVPFPSGPILLVRYLKYNDDHPSTIEYQAVEPGQYLAYSEGNDFLYDTDEKEWPRWYDRVSEAGYVIEEGNKHA
jgi:hypothetical protein